MIVSTLFSASPCMVYFGQELGEPGMDAEGFSGLDGRTSIFDYWSVDSIHAWGKAKFSDKALTPQQQTLKAFYKKILTLKLQEKAFSKGSTYDLMWVNKENEAFNPNKQFAFIRKFEKEIMLVVVNFDSIKVSVGVNIPNHAFEYLKIKEQQHTTSIDLLSGETILQALSSESKFSIDIPAHNGVVLKFS
jgi:hypothetical protein